MSTNYTDPMKPSISAEVSAMSDAELRDNLCTLDWRGRQFKEAALDELIDRTIQATLREIRGEP